MSKAERKEWIADINTQFVMEGDSSVVKRTLLMLRGGSLSQYNCSSSVESLIERRGVDIAKKMLQRYAASLALYLEPVNHSLRAFAIDKLRLIKQTIRSYRWPLGSIFDPAARNLGESIGDLSRGEMMLAALLGGGPKTSLIKQGKEEESQRVVMLKAAKVKKTMTRNSTLAGKVDEAIKKIIVKAKPRGVYAAQARLKEAGIRHQAIEDARKVDGERNLTRMQTTTGGTRLSKDKEASTQDASRKSSTN